MNRVAGHKRDLRDPHLDENPLTIREATPSDKAVLWDFLAIAAYEPSGAAAQKVPLLNAYLLDWQRPGDFGFVVECNGIAIGAAWARQFSRQRNPGIYIGPGVPEIAIGVSTEGRGRGIGGLLLRKLENSARALGLTGLCLNVRASSRSVRLYERAGYSIVTGVEIPNRVGGTSLAMQLIF